MFTEEKAAQIAAYFLNKAGGALPRLKLMKLMYLADRQYYDNCGASMTDDEAVAMKHGPVLLKTMDLMSGNVRNSVHWDDLIVDKEDHEVALRRPLVRSDIGELCRANMEAMDIVFQQFGHLDKWALVDYTHTLKEWADPRDGGPLPIAPKDILEALGKDPAHIECCLEQLEEDKWIDAALASIGK
jgi:uncharacterized phage-associated protein